MSRCFPHPPPGYQRITDSLATEPIKLQNDPKQEKKRDKKEKRKRGEKSRKHHRVSEKVEAVHKKRKYDNGSELCEQKINSKACKFVTEQLENSSISEEHGLPSSILEPCESSESTQNNNKSRKLECGTDVTPRSHSISVLRIKFPLLKHKGPDPVPSNGLVCREQNVPEHSPANEVPCFSGRFIVASRGKEEGEAANGNSGSRKRRKRSGRSEKMLRQFSDLISNWKPAQLQGLEMADDDEQGWLSGRHQSKDSGATRRGLDLVIEDVCHEKGGAACYQPRAYLMPEFNAYQMPYVIPF